MSDPDMQRQIQRLERILARLVEALEAMPCPPGDRGCERPGRRCAVHYAAKLAQQGLDFHE